MKFKIIVKILQANAYFSLKALFFFFFKDKCLCLLVSLGFMDPQFFLSLPCSARKRRNIILGAFKRSVIIIWSGNLFLRSY